MPIPYGERGEISNGHMREGSFAYRGYHIPVFVIKSSYKGMSSELMSEIEQNVRAGSIGHLSSIFSCFSHQSAAISFSFNTMAEYLAGLREG